jgi:peptide/nickel transport system substrate-binding protein
MNREHGPYGLTRLDFLRRGAGAGASVMGVGALSTLLGCGSDGGSTAGSNGGSPATTAAEGPSGEYIYDSLYPDLPRGGRIVLGQCDVLPDTLDVTASVATGNTYYAEPMHDYLERYDPELQLRPSLAETVEVPDASTLRFRLREGIKFHNGRALTAEDVKRSVEYVQDPKNKSALLARLADWKVTVEDERSVTIKLPSPNTSARSLLVRLPIFPVEEASKLATAPVGCGPFVFKRWVRGSYIEFDAFADYWNPLAPRVDSVRVQWYPDGNSGGQAFTTGELDYVNQLPYALYPQLKARADAGEIGVLAGGVGWYGIFINHTEEPFDNVQVRQAMRLAMDRQQIVDAAYSGASQAVWFGTVSSESQWYPDDSGFARDVAGAKQLLAEAGFPDGVPGEFELITFNTPHGRAGATVAQANLAEIGIKVSIQSLDTVTASERTVAGDYTIGYLGQLVTPDPAEGMIGFTSRVSKDTIGYSNPQADELFEKALGTVDEEERRSVWADLFNVVFTEDVAVVPCITNTLLQAYKSGVNGDQFGMDGHAKIAWPIVSKRTA